MFSKKVCQNCGKKVGSSGNFCPHCGINLSNGSREDFGILGKDDSLNDSPGNGGFFGSLGGGLGGGVFDRMLNSAVKMLEKEIQKDMKNQKKGSGFNSSFELFVNGKRITPSQKHSEQRKESAVKRIPLPTFSEDMRKNFQSFSREEPEVNLKRYSDNVVYDLVIPGVSSVEDISILKLENSVEVRAVGKKKSYFKILQVGLPLVSYSLSKGNLALTFKS